MECLGVRHSSGLAVSCHDWTSFARRKEFAVQRPRRQQQQHRCTVRADARERTCTAVREGYADEEDFIKAGGSELVFVQMQERKPMEKQGKIGDKLPSISAGSSLLDLVVIGCGPAGLSLAAESAKEGLRVGLVGPDLPFTNNYGVWQDEFKDLGLEGCIEHVWPNTIVYLDSDDPIVIGRAYGRVSRYLLHEELLRRCFESGVVYLNSKVDKIVEANDGCRLVSCEGNIMIPCRLAIVASGAASGKLLEYEVGGPRVSVQTAYGVEVEVENNPYDPSLMVFMDYRDFMKQKVQIEEAKQPTFLYAMPLSSTRVFFEEWSYIPVGGSLPNTEQKNLAFGAAASMVHPATGYSVVRSLSEAPAYASTIAKILKQHTYSKNVVPWEKSPGNVSMQGAYDSGESLLAILADQLTVQCFSHRHQTVFPTFDLYCVIHIQYFF